MSKQSPLLKTTAFVIITGVLTGVLSEWGAYWLGPDEETVTPTVSVASYVDPNIAADDDSVVELLQKSPISLRRWQELVHGLAQADASIRKPIFHKYLDEQVVWFGYVDQSHTLPESNATEQKAATLIVYDSLDSLHSNQPLGPPFVRCFFSAAKRHQLDQLKRGQKVVIRGTLVNPTMIGSLLASDLSLCEVIAAEDTTAEFVTAPTRRIRK